MPDSEPQIAKDRRRKLQFGANFLVVLLLALVGSAILVSLLFQTRMPDGIEMLRREDADASKFDVEWLQFQIGQGWPFTKAEYDALPSKPLGGPEQTRELLEGLRQIHRTPLITSHNHPHALRTGILKVQRSPTEWFYLFVNIEKEPAGEFATILSLPLRATNPNSGTEYESDSFQTTLRRIDPW